MSLTSTSPAPHTAHVTQIALFVCACLISVSISTACAQESAAPAVSPKASAQRPLSPPKAASATTPAVKAVSKPEWGELSTRQQRALAPLIGVWPVIGEAHKRKWLVISQNFSALPEPEQTRMHGRMKEWAGLSPQERGQARLNFADVRELSTEKRLEKWEAYQALPPEQRQHLAATAPKKPTGAALAAKPVPPSKLVITPTLTMPASTTSGALSVMPPRIPKIPPAAAELIDRHTLLPKPAAARAPAVPQQP